MATECGQPELTVIHGGDVIEIGTALYVSRRGIEIRAYDVLQIRLDGKWVDYSTLRASEEAHLAFQIVGAEGGFGHPRGTYRIRRGNGQVIVECCGGS